MLDLETFGVSPGSAIRSIGAVMFDPCSDEIGAEFYANILDASCEKLGLVKDASTIAWWARQSQQAQDALAVNQQDLGIVANAFREWWREQRAVFVWSHGGNFDEPLWTAACRATGVPVPWKFYDARCTRTAYDLAGFDPRTVRRVGTYHNALDDAKHQARCVQLAYKKVHGK